MQQSGIWAALVAGDNSLGLYAIAACAILALVVTTTTKSVRQALFSRRRDRANDALLRLADEVEALRREQQVISHDLGERLTRIEQVAEALNIEVERVGEAQRFVSKLLAARSTGEAKQ